MDRQHCPIPAGKAAIVRGLRRRSRAVEEASLSVFELGCRPGFLAEALLESTGLRATR